MQNTFTSRNGGHQQRYTGFILIFVLIKVGLNLLAIAHYGLQRDELLHLALAGHLDWGFIEVPPFIALLAKISLSVFGNSVFAVRIFPTICSGAMVWLTGLITTELGGKKFGIAAACLAVIFSPGFAASGYLFEPVAFDQLWWVLSVWLLIRYIKTGAVKFIYILGAVIGIGLLTKYTMGFFAIALLGSLFMGTERKLFINRHVIGAGLIAFLIFSPNLLWQFQYGFPVFSQMAELKKQQLDLIKPWDFVAGQLVDNGIAVLVWLPGFVMLLISPGLRQFRFIAFAFILMFVFYIAASGKSYYLFGAYPPLFAAGGAVIESWLAERRYVLKTAALTLLVVPNLLIFPMALPVLPLKQTVSLIGNEKRNAPALNFFLIWDDRQMHLIPQNYGDMIGWDELAAKVAKTWQSLSPEQQKHTQVFADNYGEASAITYYGKRYHLPPAISLSSSFVLWAPENLNGSYIIYVDEQKGRNVQNLQGDLKNCQNTGKVENPLSIEQGTVIFLLVHPSQQLNDKYRKDLLQKRGRRLFTKMIDETADNVN